VTSRFRNSQFNSEWGPPLVKKKEKKRRKKERKKERKKKRKKERKKEKKKKGTEKAAGCFFEFCDGDI
jgi:hypothetical protein